MRERPNIDRHDFPEGVNGHKDNGISPREAKVSNSLGSQIGKAIVSWVKNMPSRMLYP